MSKYRGPRLRVIRKLGALPGFTTKQSKRPKTPGQHGKKDHQLLKKASPYGLRLLEKQKLRFNYNITERQFVRYVKKAKQLSGPTGENLLALLETRLDNMVFGLGFAPSLAAARQLVCHGHIQVNQKKLDIPSYTCQLKDVISVKTNKKSQELVQSYVTEHPNHQVPNYVKFNKESLTGVMTQKVNRKDIRFNINELLVVEYYSRN